MSDSPTLERLRARAVIAAANGEVELADLLNQAGDDLERLSRLLLRASDLLAEVRGNLP